MKLPAEQGGSGRRRVPVPALRFNQQSWVPECGFFRRRLIGEEQLMPLVAAAGMIGVAGPVLALPKSAATTGSKFAVEINYSKHGNGGSAKFWVKGSNVREEKKSGGGMRVILISNDKGVFVKNKYSNVWAKLPAGSGYRLADRLMGGPSGDPKPFLKERHAKKVGPSNWEGQPCTVWAYASPKNIEHYKLWLATKTGRPVRLEWDALLGGKFREKVTVTYTEFAWNTPVEDALFKVPSNEQVRDMNKSLLMKPALQHGK
jgi:outer membrane lipoprotein-sorting protein